MVLPRSPPKRIHVLESAILEQFPNQPRLILANEVGMKCRTLFDFHPNLYLVGVSITQDFEPLPVFTEWTWFKVLSHDLRD